MDMSQSIKRLFLYVEKECNLSSYHLESKTYKALKSHINDLLTNEPAYANPSRTLKKRDKKARNKATSSKRQ